MPIPSRNNCLLVLLIVLISHATLTIHVGTHVAAEQQGCQLCTQHANLAHAVPPAAALLLDAGNDVPEPPGHAGLSRYGEIRSYHQRAPPRVT